METLQIIFWISGTILLVLAVLSSWSYKFKYFLLLYSIALESLGDLSYIKPVGPNNDYGIELDHNNTYIIDDEGNKILIDFDSIEEYIIKDNI